MAGNQPKISTPYSIAWALYTQTPEYASSIEVLNKAGIVNPYADNIICLAFAAGFRRLPKKPRNRVDPSYIVKLVDEYYQVDVKSRWQKGNLRKARVVGCYLLRRYCKLKLQETANMLGRKHHTAVYHWNQCAEDWMATDPSFRNDINTLIDRVEMQLKLQLQLAGND